MAMNKPDEKPVYRDSKGEPIEAPRKRKRGDSKDREVRHG